MLTSYSLTNSEQSKDFRSIGYNKSNGPRMTASSPSTSPSIFIDEMGAKLGKLARRALGNVEEGLRGMEDTKEVQQLRNEFDKTITQINNEYATTVLDTGKTLDKFGKKVSTQEQLLVDTLKDFKWRKVQEEQMLNSIAGRKEDSAIYQQMGSAKYTVYTIIAVIILGLTMTHMDLNFTAYLTVALILSMVFIFILTYFYWKKSLYNTS